MFKNIISIPSILNGKPIIRGTRISVELIMELLGSGGTVESIVAKHPLLTSELVMEAIRYTARFSKNARRTPACTDNRNDVFCAIR